MHILLTLTNFLKVSNLKYLLIIFDSIVKVLLSQLTKWLCLQNMVEKYIKKLNNVDASNVMSSKLP